MLIVESYLGKRVILEMKSPLLEYIREVIRSEAEKYMIGLHDSIEHILSRSLQHTEVLGRDARRVISKENNAKYQRIDDPQIYALIAYFLIGK